MRSEAETAAVLRDTQLRAVPENPERGGRRKPHAGEPFTGWRPVAGTAAPREPIFLWINRARRRAS